MNFNLTDKQKTVLVSSLIAVFIIIAGLFGYEVKVTPPPATPVPVEFGAQSLQNTGIKCGASADPCVISNFGRDLNVYSDEQSTSKFSVDGATGNVTVAGTLNVTGAVNGYKCVNGSQNVIGSATAIPATLTAAGISTPSFVQVSLGTDATGDGDKLTFTKASGVVTLKVWNSALTPVAATTVVAVDYRVCGN